MYQKTVIAGRLGRDPEMRYTPGGDAVCNFSVATDRHWTDASGQKQEKTTWFRVTAWRKLAENAHQYLHKGDPVLIEGSVEASAWINNEGAAQASLDLTASEIRFLPKGGGNAQHENPARPGDSDYGGGGYGSSDLQDIPFATGFSVTGM